MSYNITQREVLSCIGQNKKEIITLKEAMEKMKNSTNPMKDVIDELFEQIRELERQQKHDSLILNGMVDNLKTLNESLGLMNKQIEDNEMMLSGFDSTMNQLNMNILCLNSVRGHSLTYFVPGMFSHRPRDVLYDRFEVMNMLKISSGDYMLNRYTVLNATIEFAGIIEFNDALEISCQIDPDVKTNYISFKLNGIKKYSVEWNSNEFKHFILTDTFIFDDDALIEQQVCLMEFMETEIPVSIEEQFEFKFDVKVLYQYTSTDELRPKYDDVELLSYYGGRSYVYVDIPVDEIKMVALQSLHQKKMYLDVKYQNQIKSNDETLRSLDSGTELLSELFNIVQTLVLNVSSLTLNSVRKVKAKIKFPNDLIFDNKPSLKYKIVGHEYDISSDDHELQVLDNRYITDRTTIPKFKLNDTSVDKIGDVKKFNGYIEYDDNGKGSRIDLQFNKKVGLVNEDSGKLVVIILGKEYSFFDAFSIKYLAEIEKESAYTLAVQAQAGLKSRATLSYAFGLNVKLFDELKVSKFKALFALKMPISSGKSMLCSEFVPPNALPLTENVVNDGYYVCNNSSSSNVKPTWTGQSRTENDKTMLTFSENYGGMDVNCIYQILGSEVYYEGSELKLVNEGDVGGKPKYWYQLSPTRPINPLERNEYSNTFFSRYSHYFEYEDTLSEPVRITTGLRIKFEVDYSGVVANYLSWITLANVSASFVFTNDFELDTNWIDNFESELSKFKRDNVWITDGKEVLMWTGSNWDYVSLNTEGLEVSVAWIYDPINSGVVNVENNDFNSALDVLNRNVADIGKINSEIDSLEKRLAQVESVVYKVNSNFGMIIGAVGSIVTLVMPIAGLCITIMATLITTLENYESNSGCTNDVIQNISMVVQSMAALMQFRASKQAYGKKPPTYSEVFPKGYDLPKVEAENQVLVSRNRIKKISFSGNGKEFKTSAKNNNVSGLRYQRLIDADTENVLTSKVGYELLYSPLHGATGVGKLYGTLIQKNASGMIKNHELLMMKTLEKLNVVPMHQFMKLTEVKNVNGLMEVKHTFIGVSEGNAIPANASIIGNNKKGVTNITGGTTPGFIEFKFINSVKEPNTFELKPWKESGVDRTRIIEFATGGKFDRPYSDNDVQNLYAGLSKDFMIQNYVRKTGTLPAIEGHVDVMKDMILSSRNNYNYRFIGNNCQTFVSDMLKMFKNPQYKPAWILDKDYDKYCENMIALYNK